MSKLFAKYAVVSCACVLAACGAEQNPAVTERQENFKSLGGANKAIQDELKITEPSMSLIQENAAKLAELAPRITTWFPAGTGVDSGTDTEALAAIWERPADFEAAGDRLQGAVAAFVDAVGTGDLAVVRGAAGEVGPACKNCHDSFRLKDD